MSRQRFDSTEGMLNSIESMRETVVPSSPLTARESIHFAAIIESREAKTWLKNDLFLATSLAKIYRQMEEVQDRLGDDYVVMNQRGTQINNPLVNTMLQLASTLQAMNRTLGLSASQKGVAGEEQKSRNVAEAGLRKTVVSASNSLLA